MESEEMEISLSEIIDVLIKRWKFIVLPSVFIAIGVGAFTYLIPRTYESYSLIKIGQSGNSQLESIPSINAIMKTLPMRRIIAETLGEKDNIEFIGGLDDNLLYNDASGLLKIHAFSDSPKKAAKIVEVATTMIYERHILLATDARGKLDNVVKYIKETIRPVPLSSGIVDFRIEESKIEIPAVIINKPLPAKRIIKVLVAFLLILLINTMISFYREGKEK